MWKSKPWNTDEGQLTLWIILKQYMPKFLLIVLKWMSKLYNRTQELDYLQSMLKICDRAHLEILMKNSWHYGLVLKQCMPKILLIVL